MSADDESLREMARNRGCTLVKSRVRTPGRKDYGRFGLKDAVTGKALFGFGKRGLTATPEDIETFLRGGAAASWKGSIRAVPPGRRTRREAEPEAAPKSKPSRATPGGQTRLWMSVGETQGVTPIDIVNAVAGETGLPGKVVGTVDVREKHLFVDVASEHANGIIAKLNRANIKGHKVKVKVA